MKNPPLTFAPIPIIPAAIALAMFAAPSIVHAWSSAASRGLFSADAGAARASMTASRGWFHPDPIRLAQDESSEEEEIPSKQVDKYIAVYSAMQKDHGLTVDDAASRQGLTVEQFRDLENKIERNAVVHERVLEALKASSTGKPAAKSKSDSD